jgi:predicted TIM-barrel fold metal-dependent hydrolase
MLPADCWPVSVNDHLAEPRDLFTRLASHLATADRERAPRVLELPGGAEAWRIGGRVLPVSKYLSGPALRADAATPQTRYEHLAPLGWDAGARARAMDRDRVAVNTVLPQVVGFAGERLRFLYDHDLWAACVRAYNDYLLQEFCPGAPGRLCGIALLPLADPAAMVEEIGRVARLDARGVSLPHDPAKLGLDSYHRESWVRVFDAADDAGLPIFIHLATAGFDWQEEWQPGYRPEGAHVTWSFLEPAWAACDLVFSPLLTERPKRRVVLLEGNLSWLPYFEERCDFSVNKRPALQPTRPTSRVAHEQLLCSFLRDPVAMRWRHDIGLERFLWQSDFPHIDTLWPDSRKDLEEQLVDVPDAEARQIAEGNARQLLRLPAWTPPAATK